MKLQSCKGYFSLPEFHAFHCNSVFCSRGDSSVLRAALKHECETSLAYTGVCMHVCLISFAATLQR